ncbi:MAG: hypothetical protein ACRD5E_01195 [Nitrososphaeraceae archaeon]
MKQRTNELSISLIDQTCRSLEMGRHATYMKSILPEAWNMQAERDLKQITWNSEVNSQIPMSKMELEVILDFSY